VIVYPAIDIRGGRCVRLVEGDFEREAVFDADPVDAALRWTEAGAEWLHVVDLDGAVVGEPVNVEAIVRIRAAVEVPIQLGGGLRLEEHLAAAFDHGVERAILGTAAVHDPELVACAVGRWGERVAVALDARDGLLATSGWLEQTGEPAREVARRLQGAGVRRFVFTDIRRDGTLVGPNLEALREMVEALEAEVIASGGVGEVADVRRVAEAGAAGVVIGRALYDGRIGLREAIAAARGVGERG
jgi:phosphoribosylformimino-5-aminoimidazole carboxamide ribotide isomerase